MSLKSVTPMVATEKLSQTRAFYGWLGFKVVCAGPRSLYVAWPDDPDLRIGFQDPDAADRPSVFGARFPGAGVGLRLEVEDIDALYRRIGAVHTLMMKLRESPCGRPHFAIVDPNGLVLEFVGPPRPAGDRRGQPEDYPPPGSPVAADRTFRPRIGQGVVAG